MLEKSDLKLLMNSFPFWKQLTPEQKNHIEEKAFSKTCLKNTTLYNGDIECLGVILVKSGCLRVYMLSPDGREITLYRLYESDICVLSASCILQNITFDIYIDANTDCKTLQINSTDFGKIAHENAHVELFAYKTATDRFSKVMWAMEQILFMSFDQRLALFLIEEADHSNNYIIKATHEQIAKLIGSAREVVTRMLKYFSEEGFVRLSRGQIEIIDYQKLKNLTK